MRTDAEVLFCRATVLQTVFLIFNIKELCHTYISLCIPNNRTDIVLSKNYIIILDKYPRGVYNINTP